MSDQSEIRDLRRRLTKLEDDYNKEKKQRTTLVALLRLIFVKLKEAYDTILEKDF